MIKLLLSLVPEGLKDALTALCSQVMFGSRKRIWPWALGIGASSDGVLGFFRADEGVGLLPFELSQLLVARLNNLPQFLPALFGGAGLFQLIDCVRSTLRDPGAQVLEKPIPCFQAVETRWYKHNADRVRIEVHRSARGIDRNADETSQQNVS